MRGLFRLLIVGILMFFVPQVGAETVKVLVVPDNIVTENAAVDSFIYNASAEFFADEVVAILNTTDYIQAPTVSETRTLYKKDPSVLLAAKSLTGRYRTSYNVDYMALKKLAVKSNVRYVLLLTSYVDAENYVLRRTVWDFLNIPGATVVDPAYKISTYAVLVDTKTNQKVWGDTYYKTISVCENRIITRGPSPQAEQLQKIKDYSRLLCPQIAQNVQANVLTPDLLAKESNQIYYDIGNIDNVFTKKHRHLTKEYNKVYAQRKEDFNEFKDDTKVKFDETKEKIRQANEDRKARALEKQQNQTKLEVKATPVLQDGFNNITNKAKSSMQAVKNAVYKKPTENVNYYDSTILDPIDIKKNKKNNLFGDVDPNRPDLRDYYN